MRPVGAAGPVLILILMLVSAAAPRQAAAFEGPKQPAGQGTGSFSYTSGRFAAGTSTPLSDARLTIIATSTEPGNFALKVVHHKCDSSQSTCPQSALPVVFVLRNDGSVVMGGGNFGTPSGGSSYDKPPDDTTYHRGLTVWGPAFINGPANAVSYLNGDINPTLLTSGVFNTKGTNGPFAFRSSLAIGTSSTAGLQHTLSSFGTFWTSSTAVLAAQSGNVGIGTAGPNYRLDVATAGSNSQIRFGSNTSNAGGFLISTTDSQADLAGGASWNGSDWIARATSAEVLEMESGSIRFHTLSGLTVGNSAGVGPSNERMRITSGGNVGIGTAAPNARLSLGSTPSQFAILTFDNNNDVFTGLAHDLGPNVGSGLLNVVAANGRGITFGTSGSTVATRASGFTELMRITGAGNVGIGTTSPGSKLTVAGLSPESTTGALTYLGNNTLIGGNASGTFLGANPSSGYNGDFINFQVNSSTQFRVSGGGTVTASSFVGAVTGAISASYVSGGAVFGANSTKGNYTFQAAANTNPVLFVDASNERVGIGTTSPSYPLTIYKSSGNGPQFQMDNGTRSFILTNNPGDSLLSFWYGGANRLQFDTTNQWFNSGSVGIGVTSPGAPLHVRRGTPTITNVSDGNAVAFFDSSGNAVNIYANVVTGGSDANYSMAVNGTVKAGLRYNVGNDYISLFNSNTSFGSEPFVVKSGNVGIGTTGPTKLLDIRGSASSGEAIGVRVENTNTGAGARAVLSEVYINGVQKFLAMHHMDSIGGLSDAFMLGTQGSSALTLRTNSSNRLVIAADGNVGIGTTSPGVKLDVIGNTYIRTTSTGAANRTVTLMDQSQGVITYGAYPGAWTSALGIQNNDNTRMVWISPLDAASGANSRIMVASSGLDIYTGGSAVGNGTLGFSQNTAGNVGIGTTNPVSFGTGSSPQILQVHKAGSTTAGGLLQLSTDQTATSTAVGIVSFGSTGLSNSDKRIAEISAIKTDGVTTGGTGDLTFATWNAGTYGEKMRILANGNVGIGTTSPTTGKLVISGNVSGVSIDAGSQRIANVATPVNNNDATNKQYVTQAITDAVGGTTTSTGAYVLKTGDTMTGNLNMSNNNISGVNKLYVTTIDPLYEIAGAKYATYVPNSIGQTSEVSGKSTLNLRQPGCLREPGCDDLLSASLDFASAPVGSDLWLFWQTIAEGEGMRDIIVNLTPEFNGRVWYELRPAQKQIVVFGQKYENGNKDEDENADHAHSYSYAPLSVSYHLTAPRHDAAKWPNAVPDETESGILLKSK